VGGGGGFLLNVFGSGACTVLYSIVPYLCFGASTGTEACLLAGDGWMDGLSSPLLPKGTCPEKEQAQAGWFCIRVFFNCTAGREAFLENESLFSFFGSYVYF